MAERESLSAQTERLAALLSKRRGGAAAVAVGTTPKVEAAPAPVPPPRAPVVEPAAGPAGGATGGDSLSLYFKALGLEDPFSGSDAGASASIEDLLAIQGERPAGPAPVAARPAPPPAAPAPPPPVAPPPPPAAAAPPEPPLPTPAADPVRASRPEPVAPSRPEPLAPLAAAPEPAAPAPEPEPVAEASFDPFFSRSAKAEAVIAMPSASEPPRPPEPVFEARKPEPPVESMRRDPVAEEPRETAAGDAGDFLDQVSFDDPAYAHPEPSRAPRAEVSRPAPVELPPVSALEPLDDPAFWETPAEERSRAVEEAHKREYEAQLSVFDAEPAASHGDSVESGEQEQPAYAENPEAVYGEEEGYAEARAGFDEGEMLMPIDAQRAEMIRHLAQNMGCEPEDVVITALDWYLDALMNAENGGDSDAA
ncbi:hypothetical protein [Neomegalonema sp.]|uniref:hypothetical protein n=1 Tax=Neomegalonema sp. TaxID=2039713 RepID=UPI0026365B21|nr:hypothetical protein [Neomegalonema sp.]MDD2867069.1 hypothetical protein [Neomegalonema sp.]